MNKSKAITLSDVMSILVEKLEEVFVEGHILAQTEDGTITPEQNMEFEDARYKLAYLLYQQINQNVDKPVFKNYDLYYLFEIEAKNHIALLGEDLNELLENKRVDYVMFHKQANFWIYKLHDGAYYTYAGDDEITGTLAACEKALYDLGLHDENLMLEEYQPC